MQLFSKVFIDHQPGGSRLRIALPEDDPRLRILFQGQGQTEFLVRWGDTGDLDLFSLVGVINRKAVFERRRWSQDCSDQPQVPEVQLRSGRSLEGPSVWIPIGP